MSWYGWFILELILGGAAWVWHILYAGDTVGCVGCGRCIAAGECVLRREQAEKRGEKRRKAS